MYIGLLYDVGEYLTVWTESMGMCHDSLRRSHPSDAFLRSEWLDHAEGASTRFMVASGGVLFEGFGHGGPGVCLADGQTEAEAVSSQGGRDDALLRRNDPTPDLKCRVTSVVEIIAPRSRESW